MNVNLRIHDSRATIYHFPTGVMSKTFKSSSNWNPPWNVSYFTESCNQWTFQCGQVFWVECVLDACFVMRVLLSVIMVTEDHRYRVMHLANNFVSLGLLPVTRKSGPINRNKLLCCKDVVKLDCRKKYIIVRLYSLR